MFLLTLDISYEMVEVAKKAYDTDGMRIPKQKQSGGQNRTPVDVKERVRDQILSYPRVRTEVKSSWIILIRLWRFCLNPEVWSLFMSTSSWKIHVVKICPFNNHCYYRRTVITAEHGQLENIWEMSSVSTRCTGTSAGGKGEVWHCFGWCFIRICLLCAKLSALWHCNDVNTPSVAQWSLVCYVLFLDRWLIHLLLFT